jgi:hypothetical protein
VDQKVATQLFPQQHQVEKHPVENRTHGAAAAEIVAQSGRDQKSWQQDALSSSRDTVASAQGSGRMKLASWRAPDAASSSSLLNFEEERTEDTSRTTVSSNGARSTQLLPDNNLSFSLPVGGSFGNREILSQAGLVPLRALHVPQGARSCQHVEPEAGNQAAAAATRHTNAIHSLLLPSSTRITSPISVPPLSAPSESSLGGEMAPADAVQLETQAQQFADALPSGHRKQRALWQQVEQPSMPGVRGMLVAVSLLVNLLVAQACRLNHDDTWTWINGECHTTV